ncbi:hypothetical protein [Peribacillus frigoritolerans]|uniref:hypothetical protein n=1 Tax=Peribacillus frigoritolerans TaxID=450367 RepID=UPI001F4F5D07|nr:hypothetical protein [Peribacillus frigoritolerans]MCK2020511.1 hypothetical protein [Peribacillus frigoritolerans]
MSNKPKSKQLTKFYFSKDNASFFESLFEGNTEGDWLKIKQMLKGRVLEALEAYKEEDKIMPVGDRIEPGVFNDIKAYVKQYFEKNGSNFAYAWFNPERRVRNKLESEAERLWQEKSDKEHMIKIKTGPFGIFRKMIEDSEKKKEFVDQHVLKFIDNEVRNDSVLYIATSNEQTEYHHTEREKVENNEKFKPKIIPFLDFLSMRCKIEFCVKRTHHNILPLHVMNEDFEPVDVRKWVLLSNKALNMTKTCSERNILETLAFKHFHKIGQAEGDFPEDLPFEGSVKLYTHKPPCRHCHELLKYIKTKANPEFKLKVYYNSIITEEMKSILSEKRLLEKVEGMPNEECIRNRILEAAFDRWHYTRNIDTFDRIPNIIEKYHANRLLVKGKPVQSTCKELMDFVEGNFVKKNKNQ